MAANDLTWANVVKADNSLTAFTAGGLRVPTNWAGAGHSGYSPPYCGAVIRVKGTGSVPVLDHGQNVFNCFDSISPHSNPCPPAAGRDARAILIARVVAAPFRVRCVGTVVSWLVMV